VDRLPDLEFVLVGGSTIHDARGSRRRTSTAWARSPTRRSGTTPARATCWSCRGTAAPGSRSAIR
jgi:hypothetical protein